MPYLGNDPASISIISKTRKTLSYTATSANQTVISGTDENGQVLTCSSGDNLFVFINGVLLTPIEDYTVGNAQVVLTIGADLNDEVVITTDPEAIILNGYVKSEIDSKVSILNTSISTKASQTSMDAALALKANQSSTYTKTETDTALSLKIGKDSNTGAATMPVGTTAQRPATPATGMFRMNTTTGEPEWYNPDQAIWLAFRSTPTYNAEYIVIGGGGGGSLSNFATGGGAGGAGGYRSSVAGENSGGGAIAEVPLLLTPGIAHTVTIGAGGADRSSGSNSTFGSITSLGGGRGAGYNQVGAAGGGSGGGGAYNAQPAGSGTNSQGFAGGASDTGSGGGGGGAGGAGGNGSSNRIGGNGGTGVTSSITGTAVARAGGGGGGATGYYATPAVGGTAVAGGGNGGSGTTGYAGTANTGGGGGGPIGDSSSAGGAGGSGVVIIRYLGSQKGTGGAVTSVGGYTIHTFTSSGTYTA